MYYEVAIVFENGTKVTFHAKEFDVNLGSTELGANPNRIVKFTYKGVNDEDIPLYLNPRQVAGITVAYADSYSSGQRVS